MRVAEILTDDAPSALKGAEVNYLLGGFEEYKELADQLTIPVSESTPLTRPQIDAIAAKVLDLFDVDETGRRMQYPPEPIVEAAGGIELDVESLEVADGLARFVGDVFDASSGYFLNGFNPVYPRSAAMLTEELVHIGYSVEELTLAGGLV